MSDGFYSLDDIMSLFGRKNKSRFRKEYILPALQQHALERKYPDNPNHPKQQYKLSDSAVTWKHSQ